MDRYNNPGRPPTRRKPLADAIFRVNEITTPPRQYKGKSHVQVLSSSPGTLPHESLVPNGILAVHHQLPASPENKHVSAVANEEQRNTKRDSEISNASTNASSTGQRRKTHIGPWQLGRTIGRGGCSRVRVVRHCTTQQYGAAKIISKATAEKVRALSLANLIKSAEQEQSMFPGGKVIPFGLEREIVIMKLLEHRNIVRLYDVWENRNELYLIMEYVPGGELFHYIEEKGGLAEIEVVHLFRQIIAALLYCHRIHIHHRDLKPENILLDRASFEIKLVDFGMAALQPEGRQLSTPCGSPHYAAPEVIRFKTYDGGKADVWSCGVILYVMLTGTPPFNYSGEDRDLKDLFRAIAQANYVMPDMIEREAQDLIRRILVPDPRLRISIEDIWDHPFLHKYDAQLNFQGDNMKMETWIGHRPRINDWKPLTRHTVDREVLRNMRILWHSEKEEVLIQRLLNNEGNQEKYFYSALLKHRDEHLENYAPNPGGVGYSTSDRHHSKAVPKPSNMLQLSPNHHNRSQSQYSILNDEHLYSKHSFYEPPSSDGSYDPFRASREPMITDQAPYMNVTVHRGTSSGSRKIRATAAQMHRQGSSLRIQTLKNSKRCSSGLSSIVSKRGSPAQRSSAAKRRSISRRSMSSYLWPSSPPIIMRPSRVHKRGVSFPHLRRSSTASGLTADTAGPQYTPEQRGFLNRPQESTENISVPYSRIIASPPHEIRSLKEPAASNIPRLRIRKPASPSKYIEKEARKVSTELEKVMEEAFNRSSINSSVRRSITDRNEDPFEYDTPPTSCSNRGSRGMLTTPTDQSAIQNRRLPPLPNETPNTFLHRELAETRERLAARLALEDGDTTANFNEVLEYLDRLMQSPTQPTAKRTSFAPPAKSPDYPGYLHIIPKENRVLEADELHAKNSKCYRNITEPIDRRPAFQTPRDTEKSNTIRVVDSTSPTPIAPLNVRKRSGASMNSQSTTTRNTLQWSSPNVPPRSYKGVREELLAACSNNGTLAPPALTPCNFKYGKEKDATASKKRSWFRRQVSKKDTVKREQRHDTPLKIPEVWQGLDDRIKNVPMPAPMTARPVSQAAQAKHMKRQSETSSEFPTREEKNGEKSERNIGRKGFFGLFGKKAKDDKGNRKLELGSSADLSSTSLLSVFDLPPFSDDGTSVRLAELQTNWLSRFLHTKPLSKTICFQVGRGRARQEIVRLLRDWHRFGVRDVLFDRKSNVVNARVDKANHLKIKPVSFVIELFVVLEHGRRAQLCFARFTQTRGAASSFRKVTDIVEDVFQAKGVLVEDEEKKRAMCEVLA